MSLKDHGIDEEELDEGDFDLDQDLDKEDLE